MTIHETTTDRQHRETLRAINYVQRPICPGRVLIRTTEIFIGKYRVWMRPCPITLPFVAWQELSNG